MIIAIWLLGFVFGTANAQGNDPYWQQLTANRAAQCDTQMVQLLKTLDEDKKQIAELQKQLEELKKGEEKKQSDAIDRRQ